jgi:2-dehydropantoate 2-reductase
MTPQREPILIWGAGAIGGVLGAYWTRAGLPVQMVDIVAEHATACSTTGLNISGPVEQFRQVVPCVTPQELRGTFKTIVLAVKAQATEDAMAMLLPHLAPDGFVLCPPRRRRAHHGVLCQLRGRLVGSW